MMNYEFKSSKRAHSMFHAAKIIGDKRYGRTKLFELLRSKEILTIANQPFKKYEELGYFIPTNRAVTYGNRFITSNRSCLVTDEGIEFIRALIKEL